MIDPFLYNDNDADLSVAHLPAGLTVTWHVASAANSNTAIGSLSGTLARTGERYTGAIPGAAITANLTNDTVYYVVVRSSTALRIVATVTKKAVREANK